MTIISLVGLLLSLIVMAVTKLSFLFSEILLISFYALIVSLSSFIYINNSKKSTYTYYFIFGLILIFMFSTMLLSEKVFRATNFIILPLTIVYFALSYVNYLRMRLKNTKLILFVRLIFTYLLIACTFQLSKPIFHQINFALVALLFLIILVVGFKSKTVVIV